MLRKMPTIRDPESRLGFNRKTLRGCVKVAATTFTSTEVCIFRKLGAIDALVLASALVTSGMRNGSIRAVTVAASIAAVSRVALLAIV